MFSNAQLASNIAQDIFCNKQIDRDTIDFNMLSIVDYLKPYISAEQLENDESLTKAQKVLKNMQQAVNDAQEPGLSGAEAVAFEKQKLTDTLGEDPGIQI